MVYSQTGIGGVGGGAGLDTKWGWGGGTWLDVERRQCTTAGGGLLITSVGKINLFKIFQSLGDIKIFKRYVLK